MKGRVDQGQVEEQADARFYAIRTEGEKSVQCRTLSYLPSVINQPLRRTAQVAKQKHQSSKLTLIRES